MWKQSTAFLFLPPINRREWRLYITRNDTKDQRTKLSSLCHHITQSVQALALSILFPITHLLVIQIHNLCNYEKPFSPQAAMGSFAEGVSKVSIQSRIYQRLQPRAKQIKNCSISGPLKECIMPSTAPLPWATDNKWSYFKKDKYPLSHNGVFLLVGIHFAFLFHGSCLLIHRPFLPSQLAPLHRQKYNSKILTLNMDGFGFWP